MRVVRQIFAALAAIAISLAATGLLVLLQADQAITLLIYLPGICLVDALFGLWPGVAAVGLSVAGSAAYRMWFLPSQVQLDRPGFYATWEEELILLVVGLFVVVLMELRRRSGFRAALGAHQLAAMMENSADAVIVFDRDMRVLSVNPAAAALYGPGREPLVGATLHQLRQGFRFVSDRGDTPDLEATTRQGVAWRAAGTIADAGAQRDFQVMISTTPLRDARNRVAGSLVLITDITPLRELQRQALDNARHVAIAQMVGGLSHDFNHVLDIVRRGLAVLELQEDAPAVERRKYRQMIDRAAVDGGNLVRRLRDYLAGGEGERTAVDLVVVAREAIELTRPLWRSRDELELDEDLQPVPPVHGSAHDLRRVLVNLIFNAVEALDHAPGRIQVHTGLRPGPGPPWVRAWVEDSGPGIDPEGQRRLFQPYFTTKANGMGMGLFGAQKIALAHGGTLRLVLEPGAGTRFLLELPAQAAADRPPIELPSQREIA